MSERPVNMGAQCQLAPAAETVSAFDSGPSMRASVERGEAFQIILLELAEAGAEDCHPENEGGDDRAGPDVSHLDAQIEFMLTLGLDRYPEPPPVRVSTSVGISARLRARVEPRSCFIEPRSCCQTVPSPWPSRTRSMAITAKRLKSFCSS